MGRVATPGALLARAEEVLAALAEVPVAALALLAPQGAFGLRTRHKDTSYG